MISPWLVYFIFALDSISALFGTLALVMFLMGSVMSIISMADKELEFSKKKIHRLFTLSFIFFCIGLFTPGTKQAVEIYIIPKLSQYVHDNKIDEKMFEEYDFLINKINKQHV